MSVEEIKSRLQAELPLLLREDAGFRRWLEDLIRSTAVTPERFDARFDRVLNELAADREEQARKWDEQTRFNRQLLEELRQTRLRQEQGIGALGARWGLASEASFRHALKGILQQAGVARGAPMVGRQATRRCPDNRSHPLSLMVRALGGGLSVAETATPLPPPPFPSS